MLELVAELSQLARRSSEISQRSGVSVRVSVSNLEALAASAVKRAVRLGEPAAAPRISDLPALVATTAGKIELETLGDEALEERVVERLLNRAVLNVFARRCDADELDELVEAFEAGLVLQTGERVPLADYTRRLDETPGLGEAVRRLGARTPAAGAAAMEFLLEGLHLNRRLNKERAAEGSSRYRA
jgi:magnesium chelatase subunit I